LIIGIYTTVRLVQAPLRDHNAFGRAHVVVWITSAIGAAVTALMTFALLAADLGVTPPPR